MKKIVHYLFVAVAVASLFSCSGIRYADSEPLPFQSIDYGYDTSVLRGDPDIAYIDVGEGSETLLLVHGLASNAGFWRYNIDELAQKYRVIAVDLPGYGKSAKGDYPYGMEYYADLLAGFIDRMELSNVVYAGHSMGGQIGITLAINYPDKIDKLILAAPAGIEKFDEGEGQWLANALNMEGIVRAPEPAVRQNLSLNFYRWDNRYEWMVEERVRMAKDPEMKEFAYAVIQSIKAMINEPTTDFLHLIPHPTMIVYGKEDGLIPNRYLNPGFTDEVFRKGAAKIPDVVLVELPATGHMLQIENPRGFNNAVMDFISQ